MAVEYGLAWRSYIRKWIDSIEPSLLTALCEYQWYCKREDLTEGQFQRYILDVIETRPSKRKVTATDLKKALKDVTMEAKGEVNHRLVSFMEKVHDAITNHCFCGNRSKRRTRAKFSYARSSTRSGRPSWPIKSAKTTKLLKAKAPCAS
ncbi:unnamed protein product [Aphanomyces euteiches]